MDGSTFFVIMFYPSEPRQKLRPTRIRGYNMKKTIFALISLTLIAFVSCKNQGKEEAPPIINYPNITAEGVAPFTLNSSLFDIPNTGDFYDSIIVEKEMFLHDGDARMEATEEQIEEQYQAYKNEGFDVAEMLYVEINMKAFVMKDGDTLLVLKVDKDAMIEGIAVLSDKFSMANGVRVGLTNEQMIDNYMATLAYEYTSFPIATWIYNFNEKPSSIMVVSNHKLTLWGSPSTCDMTTVNNIKDMKVGSLLITRESNRIEIIFTLINHAVFIDSGIEIY